MEWHPKGQIPARRSKHVDHLCQNSCDRHGDGHDPTSQQQKETPAPKVNEQHHDTHTDQQAEIGKHTGNESILPFACKARVSSEGHFGIDEDCRAKTENGIDACELLRPLQEVANEHPPEDGLVRKERPERGFLDF